MNEIDRALKELKNALDNEPLIQEYLTLKEAIEKDIELANMRSDIARLTSEGKLEERDALLEVYNSHPLVVNFNQTKEEVVSLLKEIKDILSD